MLFPRFHQWEAVTDIVAAVTRGGRRAAVPDRALGRVGEDQHDRLDRAPAGPPARRRQEGLRLRDRGRRPHRARRAAPGRDPADRRHRQDRGHHQPRGRPQGRREVEVQPAGDGVEERRADHRGDGADLPARAGGDPRRRRAEGQAVRRHRRRGALLAVRADLQQAQAGPDRRGDQGDRGRRRGRRRDDPGRGDDRARRVAQHLLLRLHRDPEEQDPRAVRPQGTRRQAARVPPVLDEAGDRGGLHPRRAQGLPGLRDRAEDRRQRRATSGEARSRRPRPARA